MEAEIISKLLWLIVGTVLGLLTYFLKKTDMRVDSNSSSIAQIKQEYVTKEELKEVERDLQSSMKEQNKNVMTKLEKIEEKIGLINCENVSKSDFVSALSRIDSKIERLTDLFLERK